MIVRQVILDVGLHNQSNFGHWRYPLFTPCVFLSTAEH